jgi:hypothetical protein
MNTVQVAGLGRVVFDVLLFGLTYYSLFLCPIIFQ